ncbi:hypothetical protein Tco_0942826 [Tanacetum coccineum]
MMSFLKGQGYKNVQKLRYPQMKELYDKVQESIKDSFKDFIPIGSEREKQMLQEKIVDFEKSAQDREHWKQSHDYRIQDYYKHIPPTGLGLILLGDLTTIWETSATSDDDFWKNQEDWEIIRWRLNESSESLEEPPNAEPHGGVSSNSKPPNAEPPNAESSDSVSSDSESEEKEADVAPEDTFGTITQKPYAVRDFSRGVFEVGESSSARDLSYVGGLAPWALRRDLETSRARARLTEAELGDVLERLKVLESEENATSKKKLVEAEMMLEWLMVHIGAVPKPPSDDEGTERPRKKSKNSTFDGTEGPYPIKGGPGI